MNNINTIVVRIDEKQFQGLNNNEAFITLQKELKAQGFNIRIDEDHLVISDSSLNQNIRNAGRKVQSVEINNKLVLYSDVLEMQKKMSDKKIMEELNMSYATFYRHLKKSKELASKLANPFFPF